MRPQRLPEHVREVLTLFQQRKRSPISKYEAMLRRVSLEDDRLRGMFFYHAASTGRWSSVGINLQNLPRPSFDDANRAIAAFWKRDVRGQAERFDTDPMSLLASTIRGMIKAPAGYKFIVADFSQIESRVTAFIAGEGHALETFRRGDDIYRTTASGMFNRAADDISDNERFYGKIGTLACGFAGGKGAFLSMAEQFGVEGLPEHFAQSLVDKFRTANPAIAEMWGEIENAAHKAIRTKNNTVFEAAQGYVKFRCSNMCLEMRLPSGRCLHYWYPRIEPGKKFGNPTMTFLGVDSTTKRWCRQEAWKGVLIENAVQGIAADLLRFAMINVENAGYSIFLHVHDEIGAEVKEDFGSLDEMIEIMTQPVPWFEGFPHAADGYEGLRFQK